MLFRSGVARNVESTKVPSALVFPDPARPDEDVGWKTTEAPSSGSPSSSTVPLTADTAGPFVPQPTTVNRKSIPTTKLILEADRR